MTDRDTQLIAQAVDNPAQPPSEQRLVREWEKARDDYMASGQPRWRMPIRPILVENTNEGAVTFDGNVFRAPYNATFHTYDIGRLKHGYGCLRCWQPFEAPFPAACNVCGYGVAEHQVRDLEQEFQGEKWVGPTTSLADEFERMIEKGQRKRHKPGSSVLVPDSRIVLPPGVKG